MLDRRCGQGLFHVAIYFDASFSNVFIILIDYLLFTVKSNVKAFFYDCARRIVFDIRVKRELDIEVSAVLILNAVARHPNKYVPSQLGQRDSKEKKIVTYCLVPTKNVSVLASVQ